MGRQAVTHSVGVFALRDPDVLPAMGLLHAVLFPGMHCSILVVNPRALAALRASMNAKRPIAVFAQRVGDLLDPEPSDLYQVGTAARVVDLAQGRGDGRWIAELYGLRRIRSLSYTARNPFRAVRYVSIAGRTTCSRAAQQTAKEIADALMWATPHQVRRIRALVFAARRPDAVPGAASELFGSVAEQQSLLETEPLTARLDAVLDKIRG